MKYRIKYFLLSFFCINTLVYSQLSYSTRNISDFSGYRGPTDLAIGDLNNDGKPDIAFSNDGGLHGVIVLTASGGGSFGFKYYKYGQSNQQSIAIGDLNNDGKPDLATVSNGGTLSVLSNTGTGSFTNISTGTGITFPVNIAISDINADNNADILIASSGLSIFTNSGSNFTFGSIIRYYTGTYVTKIVTGDLNSDGLIDIAVANSGMIYVFTNTGNGAFGDYKSYGSGRASGIIIGDLNGDSFLDLAATDYDDNKVLVFTNTGTGSFGPPLKYAVGNYPLGIAAGDLDGDGKLDLAVANASSNSISILLNIGNGTFGPSLNYSTGQFPQSIKIGDLNGDGRLDVATVNHSDNVNYLTLLLSATPQQIDNFNPTNHVYGETFIFNATATSGLPVSYSSSNTNILTITGNSAITLGAGVVTITAFQGGNTTYGSTFVTSVITITKANLTVSANNFTKAYGAPNPLFTASITGLVGSDAISVRYNTPATTTSNVGSYPINVSVSGSALSKYNLTTVAGVLTIMVLPAPTITFSDFQMRVGNSINLSSLFSSNSTGAVSFSSSERSKAVATSGSTLVALTPGIVTITGLQTYDTNYGLGSKSATVTIIPTKPYGKFTQIGNKLVGTGSIGSPVYQGINVSISADGKTAMVGGSYDNNEIGAVWAYTFNGSNFVQVNKLTANDISGPYIYQAFSSLSADGKTAVVGGAGDASDQGAAWVYTFNGSSFVQLGSKLTGNDRSGPSQQCHVAISADGKTVVVGGPNDSSRRGAVWVYTFNGTNFVQVGSKLVGSGTLGNIYQGTSVSVSADGKTVLLGGTYYNGTGAAWVFTFDGTYYNQVNTNPMVGTGSTGFEYQGRSVKLSADGKIAIVGGCADNAPTSSIWVFSFNGINYVQVGNKLTGPSVTGTTTFVNIDLAISGDAKTILVGAGADNSGYGSFWVYTFNGTQYVRAGNKMFGTGAVGNAGQGSSVDLSADGRTAIIGGPSDNSSKGAAWVFQSLMDQYILGFNPIGAQPLSQLGYTISGVSATSGLPVTFTSSNLSVATISGNIITYLTTGITTITAIQAGNDTLAPADPVMYVLTVTSYPPPPFITFSNFVTTVGSSINLSGLLTSNSAGEISFSSSESAKAVIVSESILVALTPGSVTITGMQAANGYYAGGSKDIVLTIIPASPLGKLSQFGNKLVGTGSIGTKISQGSSVSFSADGKTAITGGIYDNSSEGAAWIYTYDGSNFVQFGSKLVGTGSVGPALQGSSVSLSADGKIALVGGARDNAYQGAAWVYTFDGINFVQAGNKLVGTGSIGTARQGSCVKLSADGKTAFISGPADNSSQGAVWVYTYNGSNFIQAGNKLVATGSVGSANQGCMSVTADGKTAIVGGSGDNNSTGAAWIYTFNGSNYVQLGGKLVGTGAVGSLTNQGSAVSISADGKTALVGGFYDNSGIGASWIYTFDGTNFVQAGNKLVGTGSVGNTIYQGNAVSLSADGKTALIAGYGDDSQSGGAVWVFTFNGSNYGQSNYKLVGTGTVGTIQGFGISAELSADGKTAIIGGYGDDSEKGAVWIFKSLPMQYINGFNPLGARPFSQGTYTVTGVTATSGLPVSITSSNLSVATISGNVIKFLTAGVITITAFQEGNANYAAANPVSQVLTINPNTQNISGFNAIGTQQLAFSPYTITGVSASSGLPVTFTSSNPAVATISGNVITFLSPGVTTITAFQVGNSIYGPATPVSQVLTVTLNAQAILGFNVLGSKLLSLGSYTINGVSANSGLPVTFTSSNLAVATISGNVITFLSPGVTTITAFQSGNSTYGPATPQSGLLTITLNAQSIVGFNSLGSVALSQGSYTITGVSATSGLPVTFTSSNLSVATINGNVISLLSAGITTITAFQPGSSTYSPANPIPRVLTITVPLSLPSINFSDFVITVGSSVNLVSAFSSNSSGAITFSSSGGTSAVVVSGATLVALSPGVITITGVQSAAGSYLSSTKKATVTVLGASPLRQFKQYGNKLVGTGGLGGSGIYQGFSSYISADGNTIIVGGKRDDSEKGAAWIFTFNGSNFVQIGNKLVGTGSVGASQQGCSVSLSADGKTAIVGGYDDNSIGAVWIYTFNGSNYVQVGNKLVGTGSTGPYVAHGSSVSLSADGKTALVGGCYDNGSVGAAWVYTFNGTNFVQAGNKLVGSGYLINAQQGISVSISADGKTALVGGWLDNAQIGAAWIFTFNGFNYVQVGNKLVGTGAIGSSIVQGCSASISANGKIAVVGGSHDNSNYGAAWVYTFNGSNYVQLGSKLVGRYGEVNSLSGSSQGSSVSISSDGQTILVGGASDNTNIGAVWAYTFNGNNFVEAGTKFVGNGAIGKASQGGSVSLSADGKSAVIGGYNDDFLKGAVWVFKDGAPTTIPGIPVSTPANLTMCEGSSAQFSITEPGSNFTWYHAGSIVGTNQQLTLSNLTLSQAGNYFCVFSSPGIGMITSTGSSLIINTNPVLNIVNNPTTICGGASVLLSATGANTYQWSDGVKQGIAFIPIGSSSYTVTGTDLNNCTVSSIAMIIVKPIPTITGLNSFSVCDTVGSVNLSAIPAGGTYTGAGILNNTFIPSVAGIGNSVISYNVIANNCPAQPVSITSTVTSCSSPIVTVSGTTGLKDQKTEDIDGFEIFPNPTTKTFTIRFLEARQDEDTKVEVYNIVGQHIAYLKAGENALPPGLYLLRSGKHSKKLIVN